MVEMGMVDISDVGVITVVAMVMVGVNGPGGRCRRIGGHHRHSRAGGGHGRPCHQVRDDDRSGRGEGEDGISGQDSIDSMRIKGLESQRMRQRWRSRSRESPVSFGPSTHPTKCPYRIVSDAED